MTKLYFGKMNDSVQIEDKIYRTSEKGFLGNIQIGDYAFIKLQGETNPATVKRLWKLKDLKEEDGKFSAYFDEICTFTPVNLLRFEALNLFVLDVNLLNKCNKQTKGLSFFNISLTNANAKLFESLAESRDRLDQYFQDQKNYRKIVRVDRKEQLDPKTEDVQFYKEGGSWLLADAEYIGDDLKDNYDTRQFDLYDKYGKKGTNTAKDKMYRFLAGNDIKNVSMMGIWDLFCGAVKENTTTKKKKKSTNKRDEFIEYCKANGEKRAAAAYESGIRAMETELSVNIDTEFVKDGCKSLMNKVTEHVQSKDESQLGQRRNWNNYVEKYIEYKKSLDDNNKVTLESGEEVSTYTTYDYSLAKHSGMNKVFYGTPGCGKSYYVENDVLAQEGIDENSVFRTTFFQDYTNTDFLGQILPKVDADGSVTYEFIPGPFTIALKCAIDNPEEKVALIIEELNRGNAPSIFGDIFQLLDRKDGTSRYAIVNINIQNYLKKESLYDLGYIKIPSNLYIFATMNTSDQNVFTLDTAFKRRWKFEKLPNDFLGKDKIGNKFVPGFANVTWRTFVNMVNNHIISHATSLSAEDKQLGKYFVDDDLLMDTMDDYSNDKLKEFAYKVFEYLWTDVAKFNRSEWFIDEVKSFEILLYMFVENHDNVFVPGLASSLPVYVPVEEE